MKLPLRSAAIKTNCLGIIDIPNLDPVTIPPICANIPPVTSFDELLEETTGVFDDLLFEETLGVFGNVIIDETGRLNNYDNEVVEESLGVFDNLVLEETENTFNNVAILENA